MSVHGVRAASAMAAVRCGANPDAWHTAHVLHGMRRKAVVCTRKRSHIGNILGLGDEGIRMDAYALAWPEIQSVHDLRKSLGKDV